MTGHDIAYTRVSTLLQNTDRQLADCGIEFKRVFEEKASGKDTKRPKLQECLGYLRDGDTLHVHSIDRLARNLGDLKSIVESCTDRGVKVQFHKENLVFAGNESPMDNLMLNMMGAFAEFDRSMIKERQREGLAVAKAKGKHCGRKASLTEKQVCDIKAAIQLGDSKETLAAQYQVSRQTIYNLLK